MLHVSTLFLVIVFVLDIVLKVLARAMLPIGERFAFVFGGGLVGFVPSVNSILAFSLPVPNQVIWPVGWVIVALLFWIILQRDSYCSTAFLALLFGAVSNLFERTFLGGVTDYISITRLFPAFNIADLMILSGLILWWQGERENARHRAKKENASA